MFWTKPNFKELRKQHALPSNRAFGLLVTVALLVASYSFRRSEFAGATLVAASVALAFTALWPLLFLPLNRAWQTLGFAMGWLFSPLVLAATYFLLIAPFAIVLKLFGHKPFRPAGWIKRTKPCNFEKPF